MIFQGPAGLAGEAGRPGGSGAKGDKGWPGRPGGSGLPGPKVRKISFSLFFTYQTPYCIINFFKQSF